MDHWIHHVHPSLLAAPLPTPARFTDCANFKLLTSVDFFRGADGLLFFNSTRCNYCGSFDCASFFCTARAHSTYSFLPDNPQQEIRTEGPARTQPRNDSGTTAQLQEMEDSTEAGVVAASTAPLPKNPYTEPSIETAVTSAVEDTNGTDMPAADLPPSLFETPDPSRFMDHLQPSNMRESAAEQNHASGPDSADRDAANILVNGTFSAPNEPYPMATVASSQDTNANAALLQQLGGELQSAGLPNDHTALDMFPQETSAYAKLVFPDGDYYITTHDVMLGRNMDFSEQWKRQKKAQRRAHDTLESYRQEPSQPSQHGDGDKQGHASSSSQSLEGRPAPPNNVSEHGGVVSYQAHSDGEVEAQRTTRRKQRSWAISKSSSTTSIDPSRIHTSITSDKRTTFGPDGEPEDRTYASIPIHTQIPEDITKISKQHLMFSFNFQIARWELHVVGNRAFVNDHLYEKGNVIALEHNDDIMIASVQMIFKLPDNFRGSPGISHGTFSRSDDEFSDDGIIPSGTSPVRRLSKAIDFGDSDDDEDDVDDDHAKSKGKANTKKARTELKKKKPKQEASPEAAKKGKKPKTGGKSPPESKQEENASPPAPPRIEPGSALDGIPVEELPQKRKGPGRPPKNGLVSKRDQSMVQKKMKEYEKRGEAAPTYDYLVQLVRAETKAKEAQTKALANGEVDPGLSVMPSIEIEPSYRTAKAATGSKPQPTDAADASAEPARKTSPKPPKRPAKEPSPIKAEAECTEEELKKPNGTYVHIIDEILREHPDGEADLPDIYLRIQKKYPHFKWRVSTQGWQSSVRHNLLQHPRFTTTGKSGKGNFWAINPEVSIEKEQKKRKATPPIGRPVMQNGQYGHPQYGNPYGTSQPNGQPQFNGAHPPGSAGYFSPYAQPGQNARYGSQGQQGRPTPNAGQPPKPRTEWELMISEFVKLRMKRLDPFQGQPTFEHMKELWEHSLNLLSASFHGGTASTPTLRPANNEAEEIMLADLMELFATDRLRVAAREEQARLKQGLQPDVNQAVEDGTAASNNPNNANGSMPVTQSTAGASEAPAQQLAYAPPTDDKTEPQPDVNGEAVKRREASSLVASGLPTEAQQAVGQPGTKRSAEDMDDGPDQKRSKGE